MEKSIFDTNRNTVLGKIIYISEKLEQSGLQKEAMDVVREDLEFLSNYLGTSIMGALFFTVIFVLQNKRASEVNLHDIADFLDFNFLHILEYRKELDLLEKKNLIHLEEKRNISHHSENNGYIINGTILNNVIDGDEIIQFDEEEDNSIEAVVCGICEIQTGFDKRIMNTVEYKRQIFGVEKEKGKNVLVKNALRLFPEDFDSRMILYNLCYSMVTGEEWKEPVRRRNVCEYPLFDVLPPKARCDRKLSMKSGQDILIKQNLVTKVYEVMDGGFRGSSQFLNYSLTQKGIKELFGEEAEPFLTEDEGLSDVDRTIKVLIEIGNQYETKMPMVVKLKTILELESRNIELKLFDVISKAVTDEASRCILYDCIYDFTKGSSSNLAMTLRDLYAQRPSYFATLRQMLDEKHPLVAEGFVEIEKDRNVDECSMSVSDKTLEILYGENADIFSKNSTRKDVIEPEKIKEKTLFYSEEVQSQIDMLSESLNQKNLEAMQQRLEKKGLCKGIAVILYGAPGTGKTETVYQLAKKTNRRILHVDIADSKSMWFGESEKLIKKIFTNYKRLCKESKAHGLNTPILLFNEADALISKRLELGSSPVGQTENAIQNILLEEMEKLEGILMATTNLCNNMDKAFERRFLFKIKYERPSVEARGKIWMSKLESITQEEAESLAEEFDFSGGEIDNVVRKCEMDEIIHGTVPGVSEIKEMCRKERLESEESRSVGFRV